MFTWARTGEEIEQVWICDRCKITTDVDYANPREAIKHTQDTGHSVSIVRTRSFILHALRTDVMPEESRR